LDAHITEAVELLKQLIATPSRSRDEARTADLLHAFLAQRGAAPERLANNVWARAEGFDPARPTLLLNSHHDTVRPAASYTRDPYAPTVEDGKLYGLGSNDAGASVVCLLETFLTFRTRPLPFNLVLGISAEEECMGENGIRALLPALGKVDMALVGEPTGMQAATGERGLVVLDCTAHGRSGHAARGEGVNALYIALDDIARLRSFRLPDGFPNCEKHGKSKWKRQSTFVCTPGARIRNCRSRSRIISGSVWARFILLISLTASISCSSKRTSAAPTRF